MPAKRSPLTRYPSPFYYSFDHSPQHWVKFGDAKGIKPGPDPATTNVGENMILKLSVKVNMVCRLPPACCVGRSIVPS